MPLTVLNAHANIHARSTLSLAVEEGLDTHWGIVSTLLSLPQGFRLARRDHTCSSEQLLRFTNEKITVWSQSPSVKISSEDLALSREMVKFLIGISAHQYEKQIAFLRRLPGFKQAFMASCRRRYSFHQSQTGSVSGYVSEEEATEYFAVQQLGVGASSVGRLFLSEQLPHKSLVVLHSNSKNNATPNFIEINYKVRMFERVYKKEIPFFVLADEYRAILPFVHGIPYEKINLLPEMSLRQQMALFLSLLEAHETAWQEGLVMIDSHSKNVHYEPDSGKSYLLDGGASRKRGKESLGNDYCVSNPRDKAEKLLKYRHIAPECWFFYFESPPKAHLSMDIYTIAYVLQQKLWSKNSIINSILNQCLNKVPANRPTSAQLKKTLTLLIDEDMQIEAKINKMDSKGNFFQILERVKLDLKVSSENLMMTLSMTSLWDDELKRQLFVNQDAYGRCILMSAVLNQNVGSINVLLSYLDENLPYIKQEIVLLSRFCMNLAASVPENGTIALLEQHGFDLNSLDFNETPLSYAIIHDQFDAANKLVSLGADIHKKNDKDWSPIHYAAILGRIEIIEMLIPLNVDVLARNNEGATPAMLALSNNQLEAFKLLYNANPACLAMFDNNGRSLLHLLAEKKNLVEVFSLFVPDNLGLHAQTCIYKTTPVYSAVEANNLAALIKLIELGADPHIPRVDGVTALLLAIMKNDDKSTKVLLNAMTPPDYVPRWEIHTRCLMDYEKDRDVFVVAQLQSYVDSQLRLDPNRVTIPMTIEEVKQYFCSPASLVLEVIDEWQTGLIFKKTQSSLSH